MILENEDGFICAIKKDPEDWVLRGVYADFLEEQGNYIDANGQRWQIENKKRPRYEVLNGDTSKTYALDIWWVWGNSEEHNRQGVWFIKYQYAMLQIEVYKHMKSTIEEVNPPYWKYHASMGEAEHALALAIEESRICHI